LSGTGPNAGGPLYLLRLLAQRPADAALRAVENAATSAKPPVRGMDVGTRGRNADQALAALRRWALAAASPSLAAACDALAGRSPAGRWRTLAGATGEANLYAVLPRDAVVCLAETEADRLAQLAAVLAAGSRAVWPADARALWERLPQEARDRVALARNWRSATVHFDAVLHSGPRESLREVCRALAERPGPIVGVTGLAPGDADVPLERLVFERSLSVNTAAAGGNASLMTIG
ncbi:MAG: trifunctional transcriptional regulator/proline dehydrogenase/L-glutamate gamma-semialdehyde dehydrogenase, partial [Burkholderiales bacterium]